VKVDTKPLLAAMRQCAKVAPKRCPCPILQTVRIEGMDGGRLSLRVTDGAVSLTRFVPADGEPLPATCAPAAVLLDVLKGHKAPTVDLDMADGKLRVGGATLTVEDAALFPARESWSGAKSTSWDASTLAGALRFVLPAVAREAGRYLFNGLMLDSDGRVVTAVGTDGRRLAVAGTGLNGLPKCGLNLPRVAAMHLLDMLGKRPEGTVGVAVAEGRVAFMGTGTWTLESMLLEGNFPDFRAVMPKDRDLPLEVRVPCRDMIEAAEQAARTAGEQGRAVGLRADGVGALHVTSRQEDVGETHVTVQVDGVPAGPEVRLNPEYLLDTLRAFPPASMIRWRFKDRSSCTCWQAADSDAALYLVMPITS
jgi:DNA polymerase-3 subunit beta